MSETWRALAEFPGYEISDQGRVRNTAGSVLRMGRGGWQRRYRYFTRLVNGRARSRSVARLVLVTFRGPAPAGHEARHLNGVHDDDRLDNLVWGTRSENERDKREHGTWWRTGRNSLTPEQVAEIRQLLADGVRQVDIAAHFGIRQPQVSRIKNGLTWHIGAEEHA